MLDGQGQANPLFAFLIGTTLGTTASSSVLAINGGNANNIYFRVGTAATLGRRHAVQWTIISSAGETLARARRVNGRIIALGGEVVLASDHINVPVSGVPEPASILGIGLAAVLARRKRQGQEGDTL